jgi:stage II sporulation protein GA (sporulation sigma-E factor processing peptidase)
MTLPVVYIDVVWIVNLIMDTVLLMTTSWVAKRPLQMWRVFAGGLLGSTYALLLFFPPLSFLTTWPGKAIVSLLMVGLAIPWRNWLELARLSVLFYFVSFVFAGAAVALNFAIPGTSLGSGTVVNGSHLAFSSSLQGLALLVAIPVGYGTLRFTVNRVKAVKTQSRSLYEVKVAVLEREVSFTGLADTGNQLRDPLSRRPVCLLDEDLWIKLFPADFQEMVSKGTDIVTAVSRLEMDGYQQKIAMIPFRGAGGASQITVGVRPDKVELEREGTQLTATSECLFAAHQGRFSMDGRFQGILHIEVITGDDNFENDSITSATQSQNADSTSTFLD